MKCHFMELPGKLFFPSSSLARKVSIFILCMLVSTRDNFNLFAHSFFYFHFVKTLIKCSVSGIKLGKL